MLEKMPKIRTYHALLHHTLSKERDKEKTRPHHDQMNFLFLITYFVILNMLYQCVRSFFLSALGLSKHRVNLVGPSNGETVDVEEIRSFRL